jgi:hypothetical protein
MDRSTFRLITTIVSPSASRANTVVLARMKPISCVPTNLGWMTAVTPTNMASTTMMPDSRIRNTRSVSLRELTLACGPGSLRAVAVALMTLAPPGRWRRP